jgi:oligogalacturonide lyase
MKTKQILLLGCLSLFQGFTLLQAQPVLETGKGKMPDAWIDKATGHLVRRLINTPGNHRSFYFHNNPFVDGKMVYYGSDIIPRDTSFGADGYVYHPKQNPYNNQIYTYDLKTGKSRQLTHKANSMAGEIVSRLNHEAYFQIKDSVFGVNVNTGKLKLVFVFPDDFKANITTVNANGKLLAGAYATPAEKEISRKYPQKGSYFNRIYEARLPRTLFTINIQTGKLSKIFTDSAWLNHVQFSPTDPDLLMFCHEGPWHKVDRIWTINVIKRDTPRLIHKRTMDMEIAGHEWFSSDGKYIWYDLQLPRGKDFYVGGTELATGKEVKYHLTRNEWSVHYTSSWDQTHFAGDGGARRSVANAPDGKWLYYFTPEGDHFSSEKLVDLNEHDYKLEPNVHFSPDGKWIIFRANFEGHTDMYEVKIAK